MSYRITIGKKAMKVLTKMRTPDYLTIKEAIYSLADNPRPYGYKKMRGCPSYRIRKGNYRIIYEISEPDLSVEIIALGHRKNVYH